MDVGLPLSSSMSAQIPATAGFSRKSFGRNDGWSRKQRGAFCNLSSAFLYPRPQIVFWMKNFRGGLFFLVGKRHGATVYCFLPTCNTDSGQLQDFPENPLARMTGVEGSSAELLCTVHLVLARRGAPLATCSLLLPTCLPLASCVLPLPTYLPPPPPPAPRAKAAARQRRGPAAARPWAGCLRGRHRAGPARAGPPDWPRR